MPDRPRLYGEENNMEDGICGHGWAGVNHSWQRQTAVAAHFKSEQLLLFVFEQRCTLWHILGNLYYPGFQRRGSDVDLVGLT